MKKECLREESDYCHSCRQRLVTLVGTDSGRMNTTAWEAGRQEHEALRSDLVRRAQYQKWLPTTHDASLMKALDGEDPPFILYYFQVLEATRDSHGWNKVGRTALVFHPNDFVLLQNKRLPTARKNVKARLSNLSAKNKAGRQGILRLQADGLPRGSISLRPLEGEGLRELEVWGLSQEFEVVRRECLGKRKRCRGWFVPIRKDQQTCGNDACRQFVFRKGLSPPVAAKRRREREESLREWREIIDRMPP